MDRVLTCILNDKAGSNDAAESKEPIARAADARGWDARILLCSGGSDLHALAQQARAAGGLVVAGGGDGSVAAVAAALVGTDVVLGVLPMGTLNHFAKDMGIPLALEKAVQTLFTGRVARVDVGEVNGRVFLNNSSIGFYPRIVREREREQREGYSKWRAFAQAAALIVRRSRTLHVELDDAHGRHQSYDTPFLFVGNNRYALAGFEIGTRAALLIHAGTTTSTRQRSEPNTFNVVRIAKPEVEIECWIWRPDEGRFVAARTERFTRTEIGWSRVASP